MINSLSVVDPHYRNSDVVIWSLNDFFNEVMCDSEYIDSLSIGELYKKSTTEYGALSNGEIFYFKPALVLGGSEKVENIGKGEANVQLDILLQMALA